MATNGTSENVGKLIEIKGVVSTPSSRTRLPEIYSALRITRPEGRRRSIAEVQQHLGDDRVRAVAMDSTDGLARGADVVDTGAPISVPVGEVDARPPLERARRADRRQGRPRPTTERWPIHRDPPAFAGPLADRRDLRDRASRSST